MPRNFGLLGPNSTSKTQAMLLPHPHFRPGCRSEVWSFIRQRPSSRLIPTSLDSNKPRVQACSSWLAIGQFLRMPVPGDQRPRTTLMGSRDTAVPTESVPGPFQSSMIPWDKLHASPWIKWKKWVDVGQKVQNLRQDQHSGSCHPSNNIIINNILSTYLKTDKSWLHALTTKMVSM